MFIGNKTKYTNPAKGILDLLNVHLFLQCLKSESEILT